MYLKVLHNLLFQSLMALLVIKLEVCCAQAIHLHMLQIPKCGIPLQYVENHVRIPGESRWAWMPGSVCHDDFQ